MSEPIKDGGAAFPTYSVMPGYTGKPVKIPVRGMSLRDWFAGKALNGVLLDPKFGEQAQGSPSVAAAWAYLQADAMLAEREKKP